MPFVVIPERQKRRLRQRKKRQLAEVKSKEQVSRQVIGNKGAM
jgi:hypothetical protein